MGRTCRGLSWLLLGWLLVAAGNVVAQPLAALESGTQTLELTPHVRFHHDVDGRADATTMFARAQAAGFEPLPAVGPSFSFQDGAFWFHARLLNQGSAESRWLLVQTYPLSDQLDLYVRYPDGRVIHHASGDSRPFASRSVRYRHPNFWLDLPAGESLEFLLRVQSQSSMQVPLVLYSPTAFIESERDAQFSIGLYYGILLALFFYNLVL